jgi:hypothetical protein
MIRMQERPCKKLWLYISVQILHLRPRTDSLTSEVFTMQLSKLLRTHGWGAGLGGTLSPE